MTGKNHPVTVTHHNNYVELWVSNPTRFNALSQAILYEVIAFLKETTRPVVLRMSPVKGTQSTGFSLPEFMKRETLMEINNGEDPLGPSHPFVVFSRRVEEKVVVSVVEGAVIGGGVEAFLNADKPIVLNQDVSLCLPPLRVVGLPYPTEGIARLLRTIPADLLLQMMVTGEVVNHDELMKAGVLASVEDDIHTAIQGALHTSSSKVDTDLKLLEKEKLDAAISMWDRSGLILYPSAWVALQLQLRALHEYGSQEKIPTDVMSEIERQRLQASGVGLVASVLAQNMWVTKDSETRLELLQRAASVAGSELYGKVEAVITNRMRLASGHDKRGQAILNLVRMHDRYSRRPSRLPPKCALGFATAAMLSSACLASTVFTNKSP